jgi:NAD(P)-dependent dehydrogenase (short-subunit alcohol dehydrogenase family)
MHERLRRTDHGNGEKDGGEKTMKDLKNKNCLLTGAASGIGRSLALRLAGEGMNLFLSDIDEEGLEKVKAEVEKSGTRVYTGRCDVSRYDEVEKLAEQAYARFERLDMVINNAGIAGGGLVETLELDDWKHVLDINLWSVIYSIKVFIPRMLEQGSGHFISTASGAGIAGIPYHIQYIASKFSVVGITEALHSELSRRGLEFSVICPTQIKTNIIDRTPISIPADFLVNVSEEEMESRQQEFKSIFWKKYMAHATPLERATSRYVKAIRKNRLYIFDSPRVRAAMIIKGIFEGLYKRVLALEGRKVLKMIRESLTEMGIEYKDL